MRLKDFGALAEISDRIMHEDIDRVYVTVSWDDVPIALQHLQLLRKFSAQVLVVPNNEWVRSCLGRDDRGRLLFPDRCRSADR
jgi:hypothetical protein